jgi:Family of unknown function (DUF5695)
LNAIPLLGEYRQHPDDFYLLRVGYGGTIGALTDIDQEGFAAAAFHSFPDMLKPDPLSGDYGPNFFGHAWETATYVVNHPQFGWVGFGGNVVTAGNVVTVTPLDSARTRIYLAPYGLWLTLDAGSFDTLVLNPKTGVLRVGFSSSNQFTPEARLRIEQPARIFGVGEFHPTTRLKAEREAYVIPLKKTVTWLELSSHRRP